MIEFTRAESNFTGYTNDVSINKPIYNIVSVAFFLFIISSSLHSFNLWRGRSSNKSKAHLRFRKPFTYSKTDIFGKVINKPNVSRKVTHTECNVRKHICISDESDNVMKLSCKDPSKILFANNGEKNAFSFPSHLMKHFSSWSYDLVDFTSVLMSDTGSVLHENGNLVISHLGIHHNKVQDATYYLYKAEGLIESPLISVIGTLSDMNRYSDWLPRCTQCEVNHSTCGGLHKVAELKFEAPWPLGELTMSIRAVGSVVESPTWELMTLFDTDDHSKGMLVRGGCRLCQVGDKTELSAVIAVDPRQPSLPTVILNPLLTHFSVSVLKGLIEQSQSGIRRNHLLSLLAAFRENPRSLVSNNRK